jgi:hypothetical protein
VKDFGDTRGVKVYFEAPTTGMQHVFVMADTFQEQYDDDTGEVIGYNIIK